MEIALRLEIANQKSLHGVYDTIILKAMRRFDMVPMYLFRRLHPDQLQLTTWKQEQTSAFCVSYYDTENRHPWMTVWSTELKAGLAEDMWSELSEYVRDYNRNTILCSIDNDDNAFYRLICADTGERAFIYICKNGTQIEASNTELFLSRIPKIFYKENKIHPDRLQRLHDIQFLSQAEACNFIGYSLGFLPHSALTINDIAQLISQDKIIEPLRKIEFAYAPEYLAYDSKSEYAKVINAVADFLKPMGYRKNGNDFYIYMRSERCLRCLTFVKSRLTFDAKHKTEFTVNVFYGYAQGYREWKAADAKRNIRGTDIGVQIREKESWYQLYPGTDTQKVITELLSDIQQVILFFTRCDLP